MKCNGRIDEQRDALASRLASFPEFELVASGAIPNSILNRFRIWHAASGKWLEVHSFEALDFWMPKFELIFASFVEDCTSNSWDRERSCSYV